VAEAAAPTVSIVITCYNYAAYVGQAIDSALAQDHAAIEIIVLDDGSTDESLRVIERYADQVRVIAQSNTGQIAATNRAYAHSRGDIVMFLDADDLLAPHAVSSVLAHWQAGCVKAQYELEVINGRGEHLGRRFCNYAPGYDSAAIREQFRRFATYLWPVTSGNAYARAYLDQLMPLRAKGPDGPLNTVAPLYGDVVVIHDVLGFYRLHDSNQSYHGTAGAALGRRFAQQVNLRLSELAYLSQQAAARGIVLPQGHLLDQDLFMVNYRLMLQKLGEPYETSVRDTALRVWRTGMSVLATRAMPWRRRFVHASWMTVLLCSPRPVARGLIQLRFDRANWLQPVRARLGALRGHKGPAGPVNAAGPHRKGEP
jgi:hypothetical protein